MVNINSEKRWAPNGAGGANRCTGRKEKRKKSNKITKLERTLKKLSHANSVRRVFTRECKPKNQTGAFL